MWVLENKKLSHGIFTNTFFLRIVIEVTNSEKMRIYIVIRRKMTATIDDRDNKVLLK
jgi:hypothetical protein